MRSESISCSSAYPVVFAVTPALGRPVGWASLCESNTADKALLVHRDAEPKASVLARLKTAVLQPGLAVMRWVNRLLGRPEASAPDRPVEFVLPGLQDNNRLTPDVYTKLLGTQGGLAQALNSLELVSRYGRTSSADAARAVLNTPINGVSAREWAQGSEAAVVVLGRSDDHERFELAEHLNDFAKRACGVIQQRNAQPEHSACVPKLTHLRSISTWLGPDNSQERLCTLREGLLAVRDAPQEQRVSWATRLAVGELLGERPLGFDMAVWAEEGDSMTRWFSDAFPETKLQLSAVLNDWADQAARQLFDAASEKIHFHGYDA